MCCGVCRTCGTKYKNMFCYICKTSKTNFLHKFFARCKKNKMISMCKNLVQGTKRQAHPLVFKQEVYHTVALPFTLKSKYLKGKRRRIMETQIFHHSKNIYLILKKKSSKGNQNPSRYYYNSIIINLKFQHKPKYYLSKIFHIIKIDLLLLLLLLP